MKIKLSVLMLGFVAIAVFAPLSARAGVTVGIGAPVLPTESPSATPTPSPTPTPAPTASATPVADPPPAASPSVPVASTAAASPRPSVTPHADPSLLAVDPAIPTLGVGPQVLAVPAGGVDTGGGATYRGVETGLLALGLGLLVVGGLLGFLRRRYSR